MKNKVHFNLSGYTNRLFSRWLFMLTVLLLSVVTTTGWAQTTIFSENMLNVSSTTAITAHTFQNSGTLTYSNGSATNSADIRATSVSSGYTGASGQANVWFTNSSGSYGFSIESIDASAYTGLSLNFGYRKESGSAHATFSVDYWNGASWVTVANTPSALFNEVATAATGWYLSKSITLPAGAQISGLKIRFVKSGTVAIRLDDVKLTGTLSGGTPTQFAVAGITPTSPTAGSPFSVTISSVDGSNIAANVSANTSFSLSNTGGGSIGGTTTGTITAGTSSVVVTGVTLSASGTGVTLTATQTAGDPLTAGTSAGFTVLDAASQLSFITTPSSGFVNYPLGNIVVHALRPDNTLDNTFTGSVTLTKNAGPGNLSGTTTVSAVSGVATFTGLQFDQAGTYTLDANSGVLTMATSSNISISAAPIYWDFATASPSLGVPANLTVSALAQNNNNGTTTLITSTSASNLYASASGGNNAGAAAFTGTLNQSTSTYFDFTLTPDAGYNMSVNAINFGSRSTGTGPVAYSVYSSLDGYSTALATGTLTNTSTWAFYSNSGLTLNSTSAVTFRIYGHDGTGSPVAGTANWRIDDLQVSASMSLACVPPSLSTTVTNESCPGANDGAIDLILTGGSSPFTFLWSNSASTEDVSGLAAGTYAVTVTATGGCTAQLTGINVGTTGTLVTYYADSDADTYGNAGVTTTSCTGAPSGYVSNNTDCNDANAAVNPGATEVCNSIDDDCDGLTDEGTYAVTNLNTSTSYCTVQAGINAATAGDVLQVNAGTYNERVVIDRSITLQGLGEGVSILSGTGLAGTGKGITINNGVTGVTIKRLTVQDYAGSSGNTDAGIYGIGGNNNLTVEHVTIQNNVGGSGFYANGPVTNVVIDSVTSTGHTIGARGIVIWNGLKSDITITNCHVYGNNCCGIELQDGTASGVTMTNNNVHDNGDNGIGIVGLQGPGENVVSNNTVQNNGRFGIEVKNPNGSGAATGAGRVVIENNTVSRTTAIVDARDIAGIAVFRRSVLSGNVDVPYGAVVQNNNVSGYTQPSTSEGFGIVVEGINHSVSGNTVSGCDVGIQRQAGHTPYPGDGNQNNIADSYFGRGNSPVTCGVTLSGNILSNTVDTREVGTSPNAGTVTNTTTGEVFCTINSAINDAQTLNGHTLNVTAGTYAERVIVNKSLTILGPNAGVDACSGTRVAEAVVVPDTSAIAYAEIFHVAASNVTISGFTIDGDNTAITSGFTSTNGADIDAAEGVTVYETGVNNLTVSNNILQNLSYFGVTLYDYPAGVPSSGHSINNNKFQNFGTYDATSGVDYWGGGVLLYNNQYAAVTNNCMSNVRLGLQTGNFYQANPGSGASQVISGNTIEARRTGVFHNLHYSNASALTFSGNTITALANANETKWDGIALSSLAIGSTSTNNTINGNGITVANGSRGYEVWNVSSPASNNTISGGSVSGVDMGVFANNYDGYNSDATSGSYATVSNVTITPKVTGVGIRIYDNALATSHAPVRLSVSGCTIGGAEGVRFEESQAGTVGGTISGNTINASAVGVNVSSMVTSGTNVFTLSNNNITLSSQIAGSNPTVGVSLRKLTGTSAAAISGNTISGAFYGYLGYNVNTSPATEIDGGSISGAMQGVAFLNVDPLTFTSYDASNAVVKNVSMSGFTGNYPSAPASNFHAGVYTFTTGSNTAATLTLNVKEVSIDGTGKTSQASAGIYPADFSTGAGVRQTITVDSCTIINNLNRGISARGANAVIDVNNSTLSNNGGDPFGAGGNDGFGIIAREACNLTVDNSFITNPSSNVGYTVTALATDPGTAGSVTLTATNNSINNNGNTSGYLARHFGGTLNATCNWWGTGNLSTIASLMAGTVTYQPMLTGGTDNDAVMDGFQPAASCAMVVAVSVNGTATDETCSNLNDGTIDITAAGGIAPYTYAWSNSSTNEDQSGLDAGTYTVTVTDAYGNSGTNSFTVGTAATATTWYADADADTYGDATVTTLACTQPSGYVANNTDCNDGNAAINPGATEVCNGIDDDCDGTADDGLTFTTYYADADGDTYGNAAVTQSTCNGAPSGYVTDNTDCNDGSAAINPGATEVCNGIDDDCDGSTDEGVLLTFYADADGDTYGDISSTTLACSAPSGYVADNTDCNDGNAAINPAATEVCNGIDDDCDGTADDGLTFLTYYVDADNDSYGDASATGVSSCSPISGSVTNNTDCNDANASINPGATEVCNGIDDDCDGLTDDADPSITGQSTWYADVDGDTYGNAASSTLACTQPVGYVFDNSDCNDGNAAVNPDATEICNGIDDNCNGDVDDDDQNVTGQATWYADADGDTYGDAAVSQLACSQPVGYVADNTDCDDAAATVNPAATEVCNSIDDDCDGTADDGLTFTDYYVDSDGDTYGSGSPVSLCYNPGAGWSTNATDCNDANPAVNPGATEVCNGIDDDCDGSIDEGVLLTFYADMDSDTYGDISNTTLACSAPSGYVSDNTDCNDGNAAIYPGATEVCNGIDDDCDGTADDGLTFLMYYTDADGDGYGSSSATGVSSCSPISGSVTNNTDCNDGNAAINPGATEVCNGIDDDCDGTADDGLTFVTYYADADGDTYGNPVLTQSTCNGVPSGYVTDNTDCNDGNAAINPGATEVCNGIDDDCDGSTDEGVLLTFYADADGDTYGDISSTTLACAAPIGYVADNTDCNDGNAAINPAAAEVCNGIDDDCDGTADDGLTFLTYYVDADNDSYGDASATGVSSCAPISGSVTNNTDCNDANASINPGATEVCNGIDDDCDGTADDGLTFVTYYADADGDTYGNAAVTQTTCNGAPSGYVVDNTDCNDGNAAINPGATEVCNGIDDDCDGTADDGLTFLTYYVDADNDAYGDASATGVSSCAPISGSVTNNTDCNDGNAAINPGATEVCNGIDDDCDGTADDGLTFVTYYADADGDTYGNAAVTQTTCNGAPSGYVADNTDCNDGNAAINPGATEVCNGIDDDCDGSTDEGVLLTFYADADGDTYGDISSTTLACSAPSGYVADNTDCNDGNAAVNPAATEVCNGIDDDCDGSVDEGVLLTFYADADGDTYGDISSTTLACSAPSGYVSNSLDCNDGNAAINPAATEICNGIDDDCDGVADDGLTFLLYYVDADGDSYGDATATGVSSCAPVSGSVTNNTDCNDGNAAINPAAAELCNGIDDNCNGLIDDSVAPLPSPGAISGTATGCYPATYGGAVFSISPVAGANSYTWSVPAGLTILSGQGTTSISVQWTNISIHNGITGPLCVTAVGTCSTSPASCINIEYEIAAPVMPNSISGPGKVCPGETAVYSISPVFRATSYNWTLPAGMTITSGAGTNVINVSVNGAYVGGTLSVSATNVCGTGAARTKALSLNMPLTPGVIAGQRYGLCNSTGAIFSIAPVANATSYLWTISGGTITGGQGTTTITVDVANLTGTGTLTVVAVNNCGNSSVRSTSFYGIPDRAEPITGPVTVCTNSIQPYSVATVAGASLYTWTITTGGSIATGQGSKNITVQWGATPVTGQSLTVTTSNSCGNSAVRALNAIAVNSCPRSGEVASSLQTVVYPNPAREYVLVQFNSEVQGQYNLRLVDVTGRVVFNEAGESAEGMNTKEIHLSEVQSGVYFIHMESAGQTDIIRLVIE